MKRDRLEESLGERMNCVQRGAEIPNYLKQWNAWITGSEAIKGKTLIVGFADFCGVNTPTMADLTQFDTQLWGIYPLRIVTSSKRSDLFIIM